MYDAAEFLTDDARIKIRASRLSSITVFGVVRNGQTQFYASRYSSAVVQREIVFGPDDFLAWVEQLEPLEEWPDGCEDGAVVNFDRRVLAWRVEVNPLKPPRAFAAYERLLSVAWPGFELSFAYGGAADLARAAGIEAPESQHASRPRAVREAGRVYEDEAMGDDDEINPADEPREGDFGPDEIRAWATIIEGDGAKRHRWLERLPVDLIDDVDDSLNALRDLPPGQVPPEKVVGEGAWFDERNRTISLWGKPDLASELPAFRKEWKGWSVAWVDDGYSRQCEAAGAAGTPLSDVQAVAAFLPGVLTTLQFEPSLILSAIGGSLKRTAIKATGCLLVVISLPLVIFGLVSGNWQAVLITIGILVALAVALFKWIEHRFKKKFAGVLPRSDGSGGKIAAAGPATDSERRTRIDRLLQSAGLPTLAELEPHMMLIDERSLLAAD